jgi:hypothetical protein
VIEKTWYSVVLLNGRQAAEYLAQLCISVKVRLLQHWRQIGREPNYRKINGRVFYDRAVLDRWFASTQEVR